MTDELVQERNGSILTLRLNRPEARNALSAAIFTGLADAITEAESDPDIRVVTITGTGDRAFSTGLDLKAFADEGVTGGGAMQVFTRLCDGEVTVPVIGAANGTAVGGGLEILLGCDIVVASSEAEFGLPEVKRGLMPGGSGTAISRRVPLGVALELALTGERIDAIRAREIGLVNHVVAPAQVQDAAMRIAEQIAANAPLSVTAVKELVRLAVSDHARYQDRLDHWRAVVFASEDAREGANAFAEKRAPDWKGR
ncbi:MAG: enoyl-CoA hydratase-related protein [Acidimicrobiales bacterium]|nr:enoyl-CoA hydratase-related protein [Acidimicrobiales bacterium]